MAMVMETVVAVAVELYFHLFNHLHHDILLLTIRFSYCLYYYIITLLVYISLIITVSTVVHLHSY